LSTTVTAMMEEHHINERETWLRWKKGKNKEGGGTDLSVFGGGGGGGGGDR